MRLERLNNLPLNTVKPNFVAIFVLFGTASSFIVRISFSEIEAILFLFGCSEVNSTWIITSGLANQRAPKALFTCIIYTSFRYLNYLENFKYLIISHSFIFLDIFSNFVITLKSQNLETNKVIIIIMLTAI